jgi:hypothetical protein
VSHLLEGCSVRVQATQVVTIAKPCKDSAVFACPQQQRTLSTSHMDFCLAGLSQVESLIIVSELPCEPFSCASQDVARR